MTTLIASLSVLGAALIHAAIMWMPYLLVAGCGCAAYALTFTWKE